MSVLINFFLLLCCYILYLKRIILIVDTILFSKDCFTNDDGSFGSFTSIIFNQYARDDNFGVTSLPLCDTKFNSCDDESFAYVIRHPGYVDETIKNDVALIILPEGCQITNIQQVALNRNSNVPVVGQELEAFGPGHTNEVKETVPNVIQTGTLEYLTNQDCEDRLRDEGELLDDCFITCDMQCANTDSEDGVAVGRGDSGTCNFEFVVFLWIGIAVSFTLENSHQEDRLSLFRKLGKLFKLVWSVSDMGVSV